MKRLIGAVLALMMIFALCACSDSNDNTAVDIASVKAEIISELKMDGTMDIDSSRLLDLYGIEEAWIADSQCFVTMDGVFPDEVIMVRAADKSAVSKIEEKLEARLSEVKVQSQSYDPENYAIAQECEVITHGTVVALFLSPDHQVMEKIFETTPDVEITQG
ncbi:MAG: DUF4358 domain-containing protein [Ruminococcus sp.]|nr:DUF4358 domain-containing protein [Ruminococcus sp.]